MQSSDGERARPVLSSGSSLIEIKNLPCEAVAHCGFFALAGDGRLMEIHNMLGGSQKGVVP